jgi:hypothetical protein
MYEASQNFIIPRIGSIDWTKELLFESTKQRMNEGEVDGLKMFVDKGRVICVTGCVKFFFSLFQIGLIYLCGVLFNGENRTRC